jgi:hypothetical protein
MKFFQRVKEIKSRAGELHFTRFAIFETPLLSLYVHKIYKADEDEHLHSHPWNFLTVILSGAYRTWVDDQDPEDLGKRYRGENKTRFDWTHMTRKQFHKITEIAIGPVTTLFLAYGKHQPWHYLVNGEKVESTEYRNKKNLRRTVFRD